MNDSMNDRPCDCGHYGAAHETEHETDSVRRKDERPRGGCTRCLCKRYHQRYGPVDIELGSFRWWFGERVGGPRGIIDTVLRLLEQEVITRGKAREVMEWIHRELPKGAIEDAKPPLLAFEGLNWASEEERDHDEEARENSGRAFRAKLEKGQP